MDTGSQIHGIEISPPKKNILKVRNSESLEEIDIVDLVNGNPSESKNCSVVSNRIRYTKESLLILASVSTSIDDIPLDIKRVNLPKSNDNRWVSPRFGEKDENFQMTMTFRRILNQITPEKYNDLLKKLLLEVKSEIHFHTLVKLIFEKATSETKFSDLYAQLCIDMRSVKNKLKINPINYILNQCGVEFKKCLEVDSNNLSDTADNELELKLLKERERKIGLMKFIAELYKNNVLSSVRIMDCIEKLFKLNNEESLEQCFMLLFTAGSILSKSKEWPLKEQEFTETIERISKGAGLYPTRLRFKYQDILDLIHNNWMPRIKVDDEGSTGKMQDQTKSKQNPPKKVVVDNWVTLTKYGGNKKQPQNKIEKEVEELKSTNPFDLLGN